MTTPTMASRLDLDMWRQTDVRDLKRLKPTHLSLFVLEQNTGHPIARMPFYAEVGVSSFLPPAKPDCKLKEVILISLREFLSSRGGYKRDVSSSTAVEPLVEPLCDTLSRLLTQETIDRLAEDPSYAAPIIGGITQIASDIAAGKNIDTSDPEALRSLLEDAIHAYAKEHKLPLAGIHSQGQRIIWAHPLGILATDHVGYLSFDLTRLPVDVANAVALALEARRRDPNTPTDTSIWLYPMAQEEDKFDALAQGRFAQDTILVKLQLKRPALPAILKNLGTLAMQNPSLTDWRLSPGSFAVNPAALIGEDGCETLLPANVALQEFYFYQVLRLTDAQDAVPVDFRDHIKLGIVHEYHLAWYHLGHSLGQILYSLPLAPGESVNLAVIDWTRRDDAQRKEHTTLDEQLVHNEHRDRTISETVNAAVHEYQHGSSFMAGISGAYGGSSSGVAAGVAGSLGGSTSNSSGTRDVAASTVQKLSDNVTQASSAMRELQSTVVVHSTQSEKEAIETRTVVNYNHSHSLTILYYEVLRHFRVATELARQRPAVLVKVKTDWFEGSAAVQNILEHRAVLTAALLDAKFAEGFNAIERLSRRGVPFTDFTNPLPEKKDVEAETQAGPPFNFFEFEIKTGGFHREVDAHDNFIDIRSSLLGQHGAAIDLTNLDGHPHLNNFGAFSQEFTTNTFVAVPAGGGSVGWDAITAIALVVAVHPDDGETAKVSFSHIKLTALDDVTGRPGVVILDQSYENGHLIVTNNNDENGRRLVLPTLRPPPKPPARPYYAAADVADHGKARELIAHLIYHKSFYSRAILLNQNPVERASELDRIKFPDGSTALEHLDNRPLEVVGDYVAYPSTDPIWNRRIKDILDKQPEVESVLDERLVTLPTRGVFAEAKLGHCNASEEIDNTRFWDWQQSPIPHLAPDIEAIKAGQHMVKDLNLQSTPFPQSLVNIVNPPNAPDPQGMTAALTALTTANIFRDMSGRAEVADLLKKLSDNSVAIAGVAQKGAAGGAVSGGGTSGGAPQQTSPPQSKPQQLPPQTAEQQHLENQEKILEIADKHLPPEQKKEVKKAVVNELTKKVWTVSFTSEWGGETLKQPMKATYVGELIFGAKGDSKVLNPLETDEVAVWSVESEKVPIALSMLAYEIVPFTGGFSIAVPGITIEGLTLKETTYNVPLRSAASTLPGQLKAAVNKIQIKDKDTTLYFQGTGIILKKDIEVTAEVSPSGELTGEFGKDFTAEATIEIVKLAISSKLKAAVKTMIGGKAGIKGTFEILYLKGYEVKQL